mmetsp:Transcript_409/g.560  ORF Transcript_409/g.560 Transcript_409/m.560 type:complete len:407 (-) Transcript_409:136-1356(-)
MEGSQGSNWAQLRGIGKILRGDDAESVDNEIKALVTNLETGVGSNGDELKERFEVLCTSRYGVVGRLALCNLVGVDSQVALLMATLHASVLDQARACNVCLLCTGSDVDSDPWSSGDSWPELFPPGWKQSQQSYSFRYKIEKLVNCSNSELSEEAQAISLLLTGSKMGQNSILLSAAVLDAEDDPVTCSIKVSNYLPSKVTGSTISGLVEGRDDAEDGLSEVLTNASARQLCVLVREKLLEPLLGKYMKGTPNTVDAGVSSITAASPSPSRQSRGATHQHFGSPPPRPGVDLRAPRFPLGGPAANFGDRDLNPDFGILGPGHHGGMLFGPGHPGFDGRFGGPDHPDLPPGVPPGARFDPYGPPGPFGPGRGGGGPRGGPRGGGRGGRGGHFGSRFGDPDPDHLPMP